MDNNYKREVWNSQSEADKQAIRLIVEVFQAKLVKPWGEGVVPFRAIQWNPGKGWWCK